MASVLSGFGVFFYIVLGPMWWFLSSLVQTVAIYLLRDESQEQMCYELMHERVFGHDFMIIFTFYIYVTTLLD